MTDIPKVTERSPVPRSEQLTEWLHDWQRGDDTARDRLFAVVHPELHRLARRFLRRERRDHTLEPNALVGELCLRLLGSTVPYHDRAHFFAIAAETMRRVLTDHARARVAGKRGGVRQRVSLSAADELSAGGLDEDVVALDQALNALAQADPRAARVVELRFFGGLTEDQIAAALDVSVVTVKRDWKAARAWLVARLRHP